MSDTRKLAYRGVDLEVTYDPARCIHEAECVRRLGSVFDPDREPWVDPDAAPADEIARVIERCPTGALAYRRLDSGREEAPADHTTLRAGADGPLYARGTLRVKIPGREEPRLEMRAAFCRCGASARKPFCDNGHGEAGFEDVCCVDLSRALAAPEGEGEGEGEGDGKGDGAEGPEMIDVTPVANGPLRLEGRIELFSSEAEGPSGYFAGAFLCRCGASENKPFCDGSHRAIDFEAEGF